MISFAVLSEHKFARRSPCIASLRPVNRENFA
jgi:hypothetical protein